MATTMIDCLGHVVDFSWAVFLFLKDWTFIHSSCGVYCFLRPDTTYIVLRLFISPYCLNAKNTLSWLGTSTQGAMSLKSS